MGIEEAKAPEDQLKFDKQNWIIRNFGATKGAMAKNKDLSSYTDAKESIFLYIHISRFEYYGI